VRLRRGWRHIGAKGPGAWRGPGPGLASREPTRAGGSNRDSATRGPKAATAPRIRSTLQAALYLLRTCLTQSGQRRRTNRPSKLRIFLRRLLSFVVLWTIVLTALFSSKPVRVRLRVPGHHGVSGHYGLAEFYGLAAKRTWSVSSAGAFWAACLLMVGTFLNLTGQLGTSGSPARVNDFETVS